MIVNKNSWHYRLNIWMEGDFSKYKQQNYTLCKYLWLTVLSLIELAVGVVFIILVGIMGVFLLWLLIINPILAGVTLMAGVEVGWVNYELMYVGIGMDMLVLIVAGIDQTINGRMKVVPEWMKIGKGASNGEPVNTPPKQPSLLWSWMKAKKDKVCPIVEFVDEEK